VRRLLVDVMIECCAGSDIGKDEMVRRVRTPSSGGLRRQKRAHFPSFGQIYQPALNPVHAYLSRVIRPTRAAGADEAASSNWTWPS
jgi:hypothetical protein